MVLGISIEIISPRGAFLRDPMHKSGFLWMQSAYGSLGSPGVSLGIPCLPCDGQFRSSTSSASGVVSSSCISWIVVASAAGHDCLRASSAWFPITAFSQQHHLRLCFCQDKANDSKRDMRDWAGKCGMLTLNSQFFSGPSLCPWPWARNHEPWTTDNRWTD